MQALDSRAVSVSLESYVSDRLTESDFFSGLAAGEVPPGPVRDVFGQYYLWRRGLATAFLATLGIDDPAHIAALPVTDAYAESFLRCYFPADRTGDEALAALPHPPSFTRRTRSARPARAGFS